MTNNINSENLTPAFSFLVPLIFAPLLVISWFFGGWLILIAPVFGYGLITILDFIFGEKIIVPSREGSKLTKYKVILWIWSPIQMFLIFGSLFTIFNFSTWSILEQVGLMVVQGMITGAVGIVFAHELMHQKNFKEKLLADSLLGMAIYGHFRTEHILVHHRYVGTKHDAVTARFDESFYKFFLRVLPCCILSAWNTEREKLLKLNKNPLSLSNPFWIYVFFPIVYFSIAFLIGGTWGIILFLIQAVVAVLHLEVVNYIEHYGLQRQVGRNGKYEVTKPHHSWNSNHEASNLLLINLQKHSDHHVKPYKAYPLLQSYGSKAAPQLPFGYPLMVIISLIPSLWKKVMNPRVLEWRKTFYPDVKTWNTAID